MKASGASGRCNRASCSSRASFKATCTASGAKPRTILRWPARQFLQRASEKGVAIVYLNPCGDDFREPIIRSIKHANFPWGPRDKLMMGGAWPNHHKRDELAKTHRILLIVSDYLGEFMQDTAGQPAVRVERAATYPDYWGLKWFINPNPMYGHWENVYDQQRFNRQERTKNELAALEPGIDIPNKLDHPHERLNTTIWMATSGEYYACAKQAFNSATAKLDLALRDKMWTASLEQFKAGNYTQLPPAIIVNLDDAVWDNNPYEARLVLENTQYDYESWSRWCNEARCKPLPGAKQFLEHARTGLLDRLYFSTRRRPARRHAAQSPARRVPLRSRERSTAARRQLGR